MPISDQYFVDLRTDLLGAVSFKYGTYIHNNTAGTATTVGNLDTGSNYNTQTDAITLVVSNTLKAITNSLGKSPPAAATSATSSSLAAMTPSTSSRTQ